MGTGGEGNSQKGNDMVSQGKGPTQLTKTSTGSGGMMLLWGKWRSALQMAQCKASMELINKNKKENIPPQSSASNYMSVTLPYTLARQRECDRGDYYKQKYTNEHIMVIQVAKMKNRAHRM